MDTPYTNRSVKQMPTKNSQILKRNSYNQKGQDKDKLSYFEKLKLMLGRRSYLDTVTEETQKSRSRSKIIERGPSIKKNKVLPHGLSKPKNILTTQNSIQQEKRTTQKKQKKEIVQYDGKFEPIVESGIRSIELKEIVGTGANATVRKAESNNIPLAIKVYEKYKLIQPIKLKAVFKEIKLMKKLSYPDIIRFYGAHQSPKQIHVIMEYFQGKTLHQFMRQSHFSLHLNISLSIMQKIQNVLYYLHEEAQIAHRDLKLQNILISTDLQSLRVIDFGYATSTLAPCDNSCGTPNYMAPELFNKNHTYDAEKVDMWAFGIIMYHLIEGIFPFRGYDEKDLVRRIKQRDIKFKRAPEGLQHIILGLLEIDPNHRTTARQLKGTNWMQYSI